MTLELLSQKIFKEILKPSFLKEKGASIIRDPYIDLLDPYASAPYPLNKVGTWARVVQNHREAFVNTGQLIKTVRKENKELRKQFHVQPYPEVIAAMEFAVNRIGDCSYIPEWTQGGTQTNIENLRKISNVYRRANQINAEQLEDYLVKAFQRDNLNEFTILDIGCGIGGTIVPVLLALERLGNQGRIRKDYEQYLRILLVDVSEEMTNVTKQRLIGEIKLKNQEDDLSRPLLPHQVVEKNVLFQELCSSKKYNRKIDLIVSGATIFHPTDKVFVFSIVFDLLKPGGRTNLWDLAVTQWTAPTMRVSSENLGRTLYTIDGIDQQILVQRGERLPPSIIEYLEEHDIQGVVGEITKAEAESYIIYYSKFLITQIGYGENNYPSLVKKLKQDMQKALFSEKGFHFVHWLKKNCIDKPVPQAKQSPYYFIEGSESSETYYLAMKNVGFEKVSSFVLADYFKKIYHDIEPTDRMVSFVEGTKP